LFTNLQKAKFNTNIFIVNNHEKANIIFYFNFDILHKYL